MPGSRDASENNVQNALAHELAVCLQLHPRHPSGNNNKNRLRVTGMGHKTKKTKKTMQWDAHGEVLDKHSETTALDENSILCCKHHPS